MYLALDDPRLLPDLLEFLHRARVAARAGRSGRILLELADSELADAEKTRLELIVTGWEAMHPTAGVRYDGEPSRRPSRERRTTGVL